MLLDATCINFCCHACVCVHAEAALDALLDQATAKMGQGKKEAKKARKKKKKGACERGTTAGF